MQFFFVVAKNRFYNQNLEFVKKTIKKMRFLVLHAFIFLTRHCQSFLVYKDDDRIRCIDMSRNYGGQFQT